MRTSLDRDVRTEIDRRVAHLTARRTDRFQWKGLGARHKLVQAVNRRFLEFLKELTAYSSDRAAWIEPGFRESRVLFRAGLEGRIRFA